MLKNSFISLCITLSCFSSLNAGDIRSLLFHGNCITCHDEHTDKSAPSMSEIKLNYIRAFPKRENFIENLSKWVVKPQEKTSIMQHSITKYALMPELGFDKSTLVEIAAYIYDTDFNKEHEGHK